MTRTIHGKVHGKTIEFDEDLGVAEGQEVEISVTILAASPRTAGDGFFRTEGALADDEEWDIVMKEIYDARKVEKRPQTPDLGVT